MRQQTAPPPSTYAEAAALRSEAKRLLRDLGKWTERPTLFYNDGATGVLLGEQVTLSRVSRPNWHVKCSLEGDGIKVDEEPHCVILKPGNVADGEVAIERTIDVATISGGMVNEDTKLWHYISRDEDHVVTGIDSRLQVEEPSKENDEDQILAICDFRKEEGKWIVTAHQEGTYSLWDGKPSGKNGIFLCGDEFVMWHIVESAGPSSVVDVVVLSAGEWVMPVEWRHFENVRVVSCCAQGEAALVGATIREGTLTVRGAPKVAVMVEGTLPAGDFYAPRLGRVSAADAVANAAFWSRGQP